MTGHAAWSTAGAGPELNPPQAPPTLELSRRQGVTLIGVMLIPLSVIISVNMVFICSRPLVLKVWSIGQQQPQNLRSPWSLWILIYGLRYSGGFYAYQKLRITAVGCVCVVPLSPVVNNNNSKDSHWIF